VNVFLWHVHGAWTTAFVHGRHRCFVPVLPDRGPLGRGRAQTYSWPSTAVEVDPAHARALPVDVVLLQREEEIPLVREWLGREPGRDVPAVYVEHNTPAGLGGDSVHPLAGRRDILLVHVTHTNRLLWDSGRAPTCVVEHGVVDPGYRYTGELARAVAVVNEPCRRGRAVGTDLLPRFAETLPLDVFGIATEELGGLGDVPQDVLHTEMARRRAYVHPFRWTSLGLALIEAMHLGMPVVALATTEVPAAVPPGVGVVSNDLRALTDALRDLAGDRDAALEMGRRAREHARARYGLERFLDRWDAVLEGWAR
jgi:hypothetical protein